MDVREKKLRNSYIYINNLSGKQFILVFLAIIISFILRLSLFRFPGYFNDIENYKRWSRSALTYGVCNIQDHESNCDYPPGYLYILKGVAYIYHFIHPDLADSKLFTLMIKLPPVIGDLLCGLLLFYYLFRKEGFNKSFCVFLLYLFNPAVMVVSSVWGQSDSVPLFFFFLSLFTAFEKKRIPSYIFLTLSVITKLQYAIYIPFIFELNSRNKERLPEITRAVSTCLLTVFFVCFPFVLKHKFDYVINTAFLTPGRYDNLSLNAFNLWWLCSNGHGMDMTDNVSLFGILSYKKAGFIMFSSLFILVFSIFYKEEKEENLTGCILMIAFAFFMILTRMHERYIFPFILLSATQLLKNMRYKIIYVLISASITLNLLIVLQWVYPANGFYFFNMINTQALSIFISILNLLLFLFLSVNLLKKCKIWPVIMVFIISLIYILYGNLYHLKREIYVSQLQEISSYQGWGELHKDSNINGERIFIKFYPYDYGLATHANSSITYELKKNYSYFKADIGIGQETGTGGSVIFKVVLDGKQVYQSPLIRGWQDPLHIEIPVAGKEVMELLVTDGGDGISNDHAIWGNAKLYK